MKGASPDCANESRASRRGAWIGRRSRGAASAAAWSLLVGFAAAAAGQNAANPPSSQPAADAPPPAQSRDIVQPRLKFIGVYAPNVLDAQADRIRAQGDFLIDLAVFERLRIENQIAQYDLVRARLASRLDLLQTRILLKQMKFEEEQLTADLILQGKLNAADRKETRLTELENSVASAASGARMNDLLTFIPMEAVVLGVLGQTTPIELPKGSREALGFLLGSGDFEARVSVNAQEFEYRLPARFRDPESQALEEEFRKARERMIDAVAAGREVADDDYREGLDALARLMEWNQQRFSDWKKSVDGAFTNQDAEYRRYMEGRRFVQEQTRQLSYLAGARRLPEPFAGGTIQDLVEYMKTNGFRFAPAASPDGANVYKAILDRLVDLRRQLVDAGVISQKGRGGSRYQSPVD